MKSKENYTRIRARLRSILKRNSGQLRISESDKEIIAEVGKLLDSENWGNLEAGKRLGVSTSQISYLRAKYKGAAWAKRGVGIKKGRRKSGKKRVKFKPVEIEDKSTRPKDAPIRVKLGGNVEIEVNSLDEAYALARKIAS